jgi:hypothetical protein
LLNISAVIGELAVGPSTVTSAVERVTHGLKLPSRVVGALDHFESVPGQGGSDLMAEMTAGADRFTPQPAGGAAAAGPATIAAAADSAAVCRISRNSVIPVRLPPIDSGSFSGFSEHSAELSPADLSFEKRELPRRLTSTVVLLN